MAWIVEFDESAAKEFRKLDKQAQREIQEFINHRIKPSDDPRKFAKPLQHVHAKLWRFRIGNYRLICSIENKKLLILVLKIGHRKEIYEFLG